MGGGAEEGEDGDDDGNDDDDDEVNAWNLRKSSASSLDTLSNLFPDELQAALLPIVTVRASTAHALPERPDTRPPLSHSRGWRNQIGGNANPPSLRSAPWRRAAALS